MSDTENIQRYVLLLVAVGLCILLVAWAWIIARKPAQPRNPPMKLWESLGLILIGIILNGLCVGLFYVVNLILRGYGL